MNELYEIVYTLNPLNWYNRLGFYYSPLFVMLYSPIYYLGDIGKILYMIGIYSFLILGLWKSIKELTWFMIPILFIAHDHILTSLSDGNVDTFLIYLVLILYSKSKNSDSQGFWFGILCFKPSLILLFPFYLLTTNNKKIFIQKMIIGLFLNYGILFIDYNWLLSFILNCLKSPYQDFGWTYMLGLHYPWFYIGSCYGLKYYFSKKYIIKNQKFKRKE